MMSRVPAVLVEWLVDKAKTTRAAMLALCALSGFISMFVENVAVVADRTYKLRFLGRRRRSRNRITQTLSSQGRRSP